MKALFTSFCFSLTLLLSACGDNASGPAMDTPTGSASAKVTAIAWTMPRARCVNVMFVSLISPAGGSAFNMGSTA